MAKADLHCHSKYSERPSEWFLQKLGAAESYTEPEFIYEQAKSKGMTFVTITDHNNIEGSLLLAEKYQDAFTGVEATSYFPEDGCKVHILIYGLTVSQFDEVQKYRKDIYELRDYLKDQKLAHSVAHTTYAVNGRLTFEHLEKLILLFDVFEAINGGRNRASNYDWHLYLRYLTEEKLAVLQKKYGIKTQRKNSWAKGFTGGSDDHAGIFIGQTYTIAGANNREDFIQQVRERKGFAKGRYNDFQSLVFSIYKIAHEYSRNKSKKLTSNPLSAELIEYIFSNKKASLRDRMNLAIMRGDNEDKYKRVIAELIEDIRKQKFSTMENNLDMLYDRIADIADNILVELLETLTEKIKEDDLFSIIGKIASALPGLFLLVPFFTSLKHLNSNRQLLAQINSQIPTKFNKKILWFTDTLNDLNGVSVTLKQMGWQFYGSGINLKIATCLSEDEITEDLPPNVINMPQIKSFPLPYYENLMLKIPSLLKSLKEIQTFKPDEIMISTPGPIGLVGLLSAKLLSISAIGVYHTDFTRQLTEIAGDDSTALIVEKATNWFYSIMDEIKVPTNAYIEILSERGLDKKKMSIFPRQIDSEMFSYCGNAEPEEDGFKLIYVGRISKDKNLEFLARVYKEAKKQIEDLNLTIVGDGPYLSDLKKFFDSSDAVRFTGRVPYSQLPQLYSQADLLVFPSETDTFGMVVLEAQCCELPALVSDKGGPKEIIKEDYTGYSLPTGEEQIWVDKIKQIAKMKRESPEEFMQMRRNSRSNAIEASNWENVLQNFASEILEPAFEMIND